jgi:hypothetical protein
LYWDPNVPTSARRLDFTRMRAVGVRRHPDATGGPRSPS